MNEQLRNDIAQLYQGNTSVRAMARQLGISRGRVKRLLSQIQQQRAGQAPTGELPPPRRKKSSKLDAFEPLIVELLNRYPQLTAQRVYEELKARGYDGRYTIVSERVHDLRPQPVRERVVRFETVPGAQAQMDYAVYEIDFSGEGCRRVSLFSYVLGYSRRQYLRFVESQDFETTLREHIRAFEHLGGLAATCLYDNMKVVVTRWEDGAPIFNPRFLAFATHYGYRPKACLPRRAQTKGKVERPFHYVETNLLNGRTFRSLEHLNEVTAWWLAEVADVRIHRETQRRPLDMHAEERPRLIPLPQSSYEVAQVVYRTVNAEGFVAYNHNFYSVPLQQIGRLLPLRITDQEVIVYGPHIEELARYALFPRAVTGQHSTLAEHRPPDDRRQQLEMLKERYDQLGQAARRFLEGLLKQQRCGQAQAKKILSLLASYSRADGLAALERATRFGAYSLSAIERILAATAQPKPHWAELEEAQRRQLEDLPAGEAVRPRPTSEYGQVLEPKPEEECPFDADPPPEQPQPDG
jgi:transposase